MIQKYIEPEISEAILRCDLNGEVVSRRYKPIHVASIRWAYKTAKGLKHKYNLSETTFCSIFADLLKSRDVWAKQYSKVFVGDIVR